MSLGYIFDVSAFYLFDLFHILWYEIYLNKQIIEMQNKKKLV